MKHDIATLRGTARQAIRDASNLDALEKIRVEFLGRKGAVPLLLRTVKELPEGERRHIGEEANHLREELERALSLRRSELQKTEHEDILTNEWLDVTRPGTRHEKGHLHPITKTFREITAIFSSLGFATVEGPEIETEFYNFDALNIPANHPARDMWDTFWIHQNDRPWTLAQDANSPNPHPVGKLLLRTHTSPVQVRYMEAHNPPFRIIVPGRVYRYEATDASHEMQFHQLEGLMVGAHVSIANFKHVMHSFFSQFFGMAARIRLRPSYFPFTEPSFELDVSCVICKGAGCSVCKKTGWLELGGAGMVHPAVFKAVGYNPNGVQGFAFGIGFNRMVMMKYKIPDIRLFTSGDLRFLKQF